MAMLSSPQFKALYQQTIPLLIGLFAIMGGQLIDSAFIGQLGEQPLAVVGFSIPIFQLIIGIQVGIGIAATACISIAIGERKRIFAKHLSSIILGVGGIAVTLVCVFLWFFQKDLLLIIIGNDSLLDLLRSYWFPWLLSCWMGAILYFGYSICRSFGQTLIPGKVMVITSVINIVLDPIFIFTLNWGVAGAAWATCVAYTIGLFAIFKSISDQGYICFPRSTRVIKHGIQLISTFTGPAMLSQLIPPISGVIVTVIVASYGNAAIGAWGLANRLEYILIIIILAITMALPPMIGKLKGEKKYHEIRKVINTAMVSILVIQFGLAVIAMMMVSPISNLLTTELEIKTMIYQYTFLLPISYGALGVCMISVSVCNAIGLPKSALYISIVRLFICYMPLVWIGSETMGMIGVFIGATVGNLISGFIGWRIFLKNFNKLS